MRVLDPPLHDLSPRTLSALQWLGEDEWCLFDVFRIGAFSLYEKFEGKTFVSWLDAFTALLGKKLSYEDGEKDMVILFHIIDVNYEDRDNLDGPILDERMISSLVMYGDKKYSAMAKTVGLPAAAAAHLMIKDYKGMLKGGVMTPFSLPTGFSKSILQTLNSHGISMKTEKIKK